MDIREFLRLRIPRPHPLRPAEIRDPRLGGNPRAGEHDDTLGFLNPDLNGGVDLPRRHLRRCVQELGLALVAAPPRNTRQNRTHAQRAMRSTSTAATLNKMRLIIRLACKGLPRFPVMLGPPGPKAIQSAVSASALIISAPINAPVLTTLRVSESSAPTKANVIPTGRVEQFQAS